MKHYLFSVKGRWQPKNKQMNKDKMKYTIINQKDIMLDDKNASFENIKVRINEDDIELQNGRDVVVISKRKLNNLLIWLYNNGCEMAFVNIIK